MNIKEVAAMAGVSISTISRVINNSAFVRPEIKERVEKILEETGYRPNALAKELQQNKTNTIGVILPRIDLGTFAVIFDGISAILKDHGYNILLANTQDKIEDELKYIGLMHEKRVDGILYFATSIRLEHKKALSRLRIPVVIVGQSGEYLERPAIFFDSFKASKAMVSYLISLGHTRIGCIAVSNHDFNVGTQRKQGYFAALEEQQIPIDPDLVVTGDFEFISGERGAQKLIAIKDKRPTAIFCITDRLAVSASGYLVRAGFKVPEDISVACIDDPLLLRFCAPSITAMSFDYTKMGTKAGLMIIDRIKNSCHNKDQITMPFTLVARDSTGPKIAFGDK